MITREQFGPYLLLKKLSEDPLGETFRAGLMGQSAMERVVLLRVFNGSALEGQELWPLVRDRTEIQQALRSPNIGSGVGLEEVQGVPYAAYDYISGKNLALVFEQVVKGNHPVPVEHALLIAERLALGLAVAYETRIDTKRVLHGFLVPQLVLLSNEGEIRLLGFDVGPGLRRLATSGPLREAFGRYLSPESLAGQEPAKTDDVYSLGAILLQLLLGRQLPAPASDTYQKLILEVTQRGLDEVGYLLGRSLGPADERISDVVTWHKALSKILIDGQYKATTFNLAFFMHNLFRDEIEKETQEIEVERTIKLPAPPKEIEPAPDLVEALARGGQGLADSPIETRPLTSPGSGASSARRKRPGAWMILAAAVAAIALGVGAYFAWDRFLAPGTDAETADLAAAGLAPTDLVPSVSTTISTDPLGVLPQEALPPQEEEPAGPSPDEILERIDAVVADRTKSMEQSLRAQYDDEIAALRAQLEGARQAQLEAQRRAARTPTRPPQASPAGPIPTASSDRPAATTRSPETTTTRAAETAAPSRSGTAGAARPESETSPSRPATGVAESTAARPDPPLAAQTREPTAAPASAPPQSQQPASSALAQGSTPKPRVRRGDLVPLGPDVAPPKLVGRLEPRYPMMAQKLKKEASLYVSVLVDEEGRVAQAKLAQDEVGFGFDEAALQAARRARFEPARKDGVVVKTWTNLKLEFRLQ